MAVPSPSDKRAPAGNPKPCAVTSSVDAATDGGPLTATSARVTADSGASTAPSWTQVYSSHLAGCAGKEGGCHIEMINAGSAYGWLQGQRQISGKGSLLAVPGQSCLTWYGAPGSMPPCGGSDSQAVSDINAWSAAGALDN